MANNTPNIRAALQTISQASIESLVPHILELCEANAAIAKAYKFSGSGSASSHL
ncbi:hypothetical protein PSV08DRAFT_284844, partial [Bipolaris maydis]|uniref:uncharacterized protein n=1 Tax=Cochliobolus heterostrophus TaxID=5016 RepID=UPI0024DBD3BC